MINIYLSDTEAVEACVCRLNVMVMWCDERARERKFRELSFPGNESSRERKVSGTKVPHRDYSFLGTKGLGHEKSRYHPGSTKNNNRDEKHNTVVSLFCGTH